MGMMWQKLMNGLAAEESFPAIAGVATSTSATLSTTHTINLPSNITSGDILLMLLGWEDENDQFTSLSETWTILYNNSPDRLRLMLLWRVANGTEGATTTLTTATSSRRATACVYRITGGQDLESATGTVSSGSTVDPPNLSPSWGSSKTLWVAVSANEDGRRTIASYPTNYTLSQTTVSLADGDKALRATFSARELEAASEDPGVYTLSSSTSAIGFTVAIQPN